jgi:hypothetical protein
MPSREEDIIQLYEDIQQPDSFLLQDSFTITNRHNQNVPPEYMPNSELYFLLFSEDSDYEMCVTPRVPPNFKLKEPIEKMDSLYEMDDEFERMLEALSGEKIDLSKVDAMFSS